MTKWYAIITDRTGKQFTIGEYSRKELNKTLKKIHESGFANLDECQVSIYTVEI